ADPALLALRRHLGCGRDPRRHPAHARVGRPALSRPRRGYLKETLMAGPPTGPTTLSSGAHADFSAEKSYGDFLCLDELRACQRMLGDSNNESLFIIQHQVSELWMKQVILELKAAIARVKGDDLPPAFKMLARVSRIMGQLIQAWDVLSTLTASEYM